MSNFEKICDWYRVDLHAGMSSREIFNRLIEKNGRSSIPMIFVIWSIWPIIAGYYGTTLLRTAINQFASTIPWKLANKTMGGLDGFSNKPVRVNKYVLKL